MNQGIGKAREDLSLCLILASFTMVCRKQG